MHFKVISFETRSLSQNEFARYFVFPFRTFDDEDQKEGALEKFEFDENLLSSISQAAGINDSTSDPVIEQEKLFRSTSFRSTTPSRYNNHSLDIDHPSFESNMATGDDYYHTSIDGYNQGNRKFTYVSQV